MQTIFRFIKSLFLIDLLKGLWITLKYTPQPAFTFQYPAERRPGQQGGRPSRGPEVVLTIKVTCGLALARPQVLDDLPNQLGPLDPDQAVIEPAVEVRQPVRVESHLVQNRGVQVPHVRAVGHRGAA